MRIEAAEERGANEFFVFPLGYMAVVDEVFFAETEVDDVDLLVWVF
jgi:hypothetical protein